MPLLREDLLNPLPHPPGENLEYTPVYRQIREALREDTDDGPRKDWDRELKKADHRLVVKLAGDAIATKSKDLQLAVWMSESLVRIEGTAALPECIKLLYDLMEQFWDTLYPQLDNGSPVFRFPLLERFTIRCDYLLRRLPLTRSGLNWFKYLEAREVPYKKDTEEDDEDKEKEKKRNAAKDEGKLMPEEFDDAVDETPREFYLAFADHLRTASQALAALESFCRERCNDQEEEPNFSRLVRAITDIGSVVDILLGKKGRAQLPRSLPSTAPPAASAAIDETQTVGLRQVLPSAVPEAAIPPADLPASDRSTSAPLLPQFAAELAPANAQDAFTIVARIAEHLRKADPASVTPYLLLRSLRWGELRSKGDQPDTAWLVAPATEKRQELIRLAQENDWPELLASAESAVASPSGRVWLDIHRYSWQACDALGFDAAAKAIGSELKALLADFPNLPTWKFNDETTVASDATQAWLKENVISPVSAVPVPLLPAPVENAPSVAQHENGHANPWDVAVQLAQSGSLQQAVEFLSGQPLHDDSGREKFLRQLQVAHLCLITGRAAIAYPILQELFAEIQRRELLGWESRTFIVRPLVLLVQCIDQTSRDVQQRSEIYNLLCRLEPGVALQFQSS